MNFLEKEELSHFRFQKDFLRPFEYTIVNNKNSDAREMASAPPRLADVRSCNACSKCSKHGYKIYGQVGGPCLRHFPRRPKSLQSG